jgi:hypothetical protein
MTLPKIDKPIFEVYLKSLDKIVKYRPFLVKEEKLLLMASEGQDIKQVIDVVRQIARNCIVDDINVDTLPLFDIEMLFLHLRAKSVGEVASIRFKCENVIKKEDDTEQTCGFFTDLDYNILDSKYSTDEAISDIVKLSDTVSMKMKFPDISKIANYREDFENLDFVISFIVENIDSIISGDEIYDTKTVSKEELTTFVEELSSQQIGAVTAFFNSAPKVVANIKYKCTQCGMDHDFNVEGIQNFFG